jgi:transposase
MFQRPTSGHLSLQQKGSIVALYQRNVPVIDIAQNVGCHRNTVTKWINRYQENFDVLRKVGSGRPRKTTPNQDAMLLQAVRAKPFTSLQELKGIYFHIRCRRY